MSFFENNKDKFKTVGISTVKGIGKGTAAVGKAGYRTYKKSEARSNGTEYVEPSSTEQSSYHSTSKPINNVDLSSLPAPPKRNVGINQSPAPNSTLQNAPNNSVAQRPPLPARTSVPVVNPSREAPDLTHPPPSYTTANQEAFQQVPPYSASTQESFTPVGTASSDVANTTNPTSAPTISSTRTLQNSTPTHQIDLFSLPPPPLHKDRGSPKLKDATATGQQPKRQSLDNVVTSSSVTNLQAPIHEDSPKPPPLPSRKSASSPSNSSSANAQVINDISERLRQNSIGPSASASSQSQDQSSSLNSNGRPSSTFAGQNFVAANNLIGNTNSEQSKPPIKQKPIVKAKPEIKPKPGVKPKPEVKPKPGVKPKPEIKSKPEVKPKPEIKPKPGSKPQSDIRAALDARFRTTANSKQANDLGSGEDSTPQSAKASSLAPPASIIETNNSHTETENQTPPPILPRRNYTRPNTTPSDITNAHYDFSNVDLELQTRWYESQDLGNVPSYFRGLNCQTSLQYMTSGSGSIFKREISFLLRDLSKVTYEITWGDGQAPEAKVSSFVPSPFKTVKPSVADLVSFHEQFGNVIASWSENKKGQQVGRGECWDLVHDALVKACGKHAFVSTYTHHGFPILHLRGTGNGFESLALETPCDQLRRGDILQYERCIFKDKQTGATTTAGDPDHTSIILGTLDQKVIVAEQNVNNVKKVVANQLNIPSLIQGELIAYRPVPAKLLQTV
ncbi:Piso0_002605 [Millerozyma farinosa CBS 7064]|uniref:Piso0_002605 protein n=1 Tax=Pichia sorbitophila (strain ATCC MYA-4447 / BCRC 22081 / CBS 7064 / NBRC 10061 / NRRL Y-12695) TaxID=559304 RepID=G8YD23_PICSO|nr:Piso0_002605 [Millerozyma farinosa CBS 7064]